MRQTRSNNNQPNKPNNNNNEKIYYIIIGVLLVILLAIVIFIFANRDSATDLDDSDINPETGEMLDVDETDDEDDMEVDEEADSDSEETEEETDQSETEPEEDEAEEETDAETDETEEATDVDEETEEDTEDQTEETDYEVTENAPLDESHQVNYSDGSSDRIAIADAASSITGLDPNEMITNWVGNDGPGRVFTIVSNVSQSEVYRLTLQYGERQWHVTGVQELDSVPAEYN